MPYTSLPSESVSASPADTGSPAHSGSRGSAPVERANPVPLMIRERDLPGLLGLSRATIRRAMAAGRFPACVRVGRCVAWRVVDLERWIAGGCGAVEGGSQ